MPDCFLIRARIPVDVVQDQGRILIRRGRFAKTMELQPMNELQFRSETAFIHISVEDRLLSRTGIRGHSQCPSGQGRNRTPGRKVSIRLPYDGMGVSLGGHEQYPYGVATVLQTQGPGLVQDRITPIVIILRLFRIVLAIGRDFLDDLNRPLD